MNSSESAKLLLAACGGDTIKLFDISGEPQNPCLLTHSPSPGMRVNSVKWNHNNLVLASGGEDGRISLWRKNGRSLWTVPAKGSRGETVEPSECISAISFSNKGSRYLCSGGTGQVVRIWDLQNKRCVKWLKGHTDTITGIMYNCKDEHIASVSRKGDLILHNLASGTRAAELRDPNGQVLGALDYSRMSRHLLVTAGDDGSIHLWDTTGRSPKVSWLNQHSAPTSAVGFSPSNDKIIASAGLDMKLYTFDAGSRKPSSCIPYEAPFSSLAFSDDGLTLAAGTSTGQVVFYDVRGKPQPITVLRAYGNSEAVSNLSWQRSKPVTVNENSCTDENILLAGDIGDSILMPDPLPSRSSSGISMASLVPGSRIPARSGSGDLFSFSGGSSASLSSVHSSHIAEETPVRSSLLTGGALSRLNAPRYNFKDDMDVFSPLVEVQPVTPSFDNLWDDSSKKDLDRQPSFLFPSRKLGLSEDGALDNHPISDWKSKQDDIHSTFPQLTSTSVNPRSDDLSSITPPEAWGGERLSDKLIQHRTKSSTGQANLETPGPALSLPRRFLSSYAERIGATTSMADASSFAVGSPKSKKTGAETREELLNSVLSRSEMPSATGAGAHTFTNGGAMHLDKTSSQSDPLGTSFTLQLFQRTLDERLVSVQESNHEDIRNLHIEVLRQFHLHEMQMSSALKLLAENQAKLMEEMQALRKENQQLRQLL